MDWNGPNDPDNPRNFSLARRFMGIVSITLLAFVSAFAGAIYAPTQTAVMEVMNCSSEITILPLILYNLGLAFGPHFGTSLSKTYSRKAVYLTTTSVLILFMIGGAVSNTISGLTLCRFFAAVFGLSNISNASAIILDYMHDSKRGTVLAIYYTLPTVTATLAPLVPVILIVAFFSPLIFTRETYKAVILRCRATQQGMADHLFIILFQRPIHILLTEPIVIFISLYNGFLFSLLYAFVISVPWVFEKYYGFNLTTQTLTYLNMTVGDMVACISYALIDRYFFLPRLHSWKQAHEPSLKIPLESHLVSALGGSLLLPPSLLILIFIVLQGLSMFSCLLVYSGTNLYMMDTYGLFYGASASGAMMFSRYILSCAFLMFILQIFEELGVGWATTVLATLTLFIALIPWIFWIYESQIRKVSKYKTTL
ncbi:bicyclomycin resistance protein [Aspergillus eucalypticola CBS 122712]|uniref:Bicyclomycin resistance protein n=1 Tax=Aspergillus eucalypticola (strain CBS 122712 / IBT 29274) TaxID=1448314 RepID=A0A317UJU7_ASPEC|nr:bicyclomycin resistance protein [Aspergillus eucalypticola CBS 122712]PWY61961.1 bicyclomycin resistance protein [Aspergillus eucalypticola CBS 122712]